MKMFSTAECELCKVEIGRLGWKLQIKDEKIICSTCYALANFDGKAGPAKKLVNMPLDEFDMLVQKGREMVEQHNEEFERKVEEHTAFTVTKKIGDMLEIDEPNEKWRIPVKLGLPKIHTFDEIISFELLEEGETITKGGLGGAVAGGLLLGGTGAVVGSVIGKKQAKPMCSSMSIKIVLNSLDFPNEFIRVIESPMKRSGFLWDIYFGAAQECLSVLQLICDRQSGKIKLLK